MMAFFVLLLVALFLVVMFCKKALRVVLSIAIIFAILCCAFLSLDTKVHKPQNEEPIFDDSSETLNSGDDLLQLKNIKSDIIDRIEVSIEDVNSTEGLSYTEPVVIKDRSEISEVLNIINMSTLYPDDEFERKYGVGGFFEGATELIMCDVTGRKYTIFCMDDFGDENIFFISESDDYSDKVLYKTSYKLETKLKELHNSNLSYNSNNSILDNDNLSSNNSEEISEELKLFLQYVAYLNEAEDVHYVGMTEEGIKLDIASYFVESYTYDDEYELLAFKRDGIESAIKELFDETVDLNTESALGLKYDKNTDSFVFETGGDGCVSTYLVKVEKNKYLGGGIHSTTFVYAYPNESDFFDETLSECDCFRTEIEYKENDNYTYSKYQLVNGQNIQSEYVGKIKDFQM